MPLRRLITLLLLLIMLPVCAGAEELSFIVTEDGENDNAPTAEVPTATPAPAFAPLAWDIKSSPIRPDPDAYLPDHTGYHDDSIDVQVRTWTHGKTLITGMFVTISDVSQFRTGMATSREPYAIAALVATMSKKFHAVCAVSGDWFGSHSEGIVIRNTRQIRVRPSKNRDTLIVDNKGDFHIITATTMAKWKTWLETHTAIHTFCFGPALVIDGQLNEAAGSSNLSNLGKDKRIQRTAAGQLGPLSYVFVTCDGPENQPGAGLTITEMAEVMAELGCTQAYNLDGASSSTLVLNHVKINAKGSKKRPVGDCIWFATLSGEK